ncbi:MAG: hypothetical protein L6V81_00920 [Clostridium sp.]|nr:MAG: hypothetical protein L6V81_00920 [Clostridium sp.]
MYMKLKPMYSINGIDYTEIPNEALNGGKIRINLPIPSSVKDTHAKVKHISNGNVIDEKKNMKLIKQKMEKNISQSKQQVSQHLKFHISQQKI